MTGKYDIRAIKGVSARELQKYYNGNLTQKEGLRIAKCLADISKK